MKNYNPFDINSFLLKTVYAKLANNSKQIEMLPGFYIIFAANVDFNVPLTIFYLNKYVSLSSSNIYFL